MSKRPVREALADSEILARRVRAQRLAVRPASGVVDVVTQAAGLQAQDSAAARLAVRARSAETTAESVRRACAEERSVVRTWLMRGTLHMVPAADLRWLLGLFGRRNAAAGEGRRRELGLDERLCERALGAIERALAAEAPLSRAALVERIAERGVVIDRAGQAPAHLVGYAAARGLLCRGPDLDKDEPGYVLVDAWVPAGPAIDEEAALARLARRYVGAYGPASADDLAAWSGLPLGKAKQGLVLAARDITEIAPGMFVPNDAVEGPPAGSPVVRLLGAFDAYLLGYRGRALALPPRYEKRIQAGGGLIHPAVLVDGRVVGRWRLRKGPRRLDVTVEPFEALDRALVPALEAEAADLGRFLGVEAASCEVKPPVA